MMGTYSMGFWDQVILVGMLIFVSYTIGQSLKRRPEALSLDNLNKSFRFMGLLAIFLIGFVAFLILMLPSNPGPTHDGAVPRVESDNNPARPTRTL